MALWSTYARRPKTTAQKMATQSMQRYSKRNTWQYRELELSREPQAWCCGRRAVRLGKRGLPTLWGKEGREEEGQKGSSAADGSAGAEPATGICASVTLGAVGPGMVIACLVDGSGAECLELHTNDVVVTGLPVGGSWLSVDLLGTVNCS